MIESSARSSQLPTGTVTFLFTDIEGSTRLVQELGDRYADLLSEHCSILRASIADANGIELGTEGDSFFAVFADAADAVSATTAAQRELDRHVWPADARSTSFGVISKARLAEGKKFWYPPSRLAGTNPTPPGPGPTRPSALTRRPMRRSPPFDIATYLP